MSEEYVENNIMYRNNIRLYGGGLQWQIQAR